MDYVTPFLKWLLKSDYIRGNRLFLNAVEAKDNNIQIVTQQITRSQDREFVDGSVLHRVMFTVFDFKSISFNQLVKTMVERAENVVDLLEAGQIIDYVEQKNKEKDFPDFGKDFEVQSIYSEYGSPSTPAVDGAMQLAKYSIPIVCEVLDFRECFWQ